MADKYYSDFKAERAAKMAALQRAQNTHNRNKPIFGAQKVAERLNRVLGWNSKNPVGRMGKEKLIMAYLWKRKALRREGKYLVADRIRFERCLDTLIRVTDPGPDETHPLEYAVGWAKRPRNRRPKKAEPLPPQEPSFPSIPSDERLCTHYRKLQLKIRPRPDKL